MVAPEWQLWIDVTNAVSAHQRKHCLLLETTLLPWSDFKSHSCCVNISVQNGSMHTGGHAALCAQMCSDNVVDA